MNCRELLWHRHHEDSPGLCSPAVQLWLTHSSWAQRAAAPPQGTWASSLTEATQRHGPNTALLHTLFSKAASSRLRHSKVCCFFLFLTFLFLLCLLSNIFPKPLPLLAFSTSHSFCSILGWFFTYFNTFLFLDKWLWSYLCFSQNINFVT